MSSIVEVSGTVEDLFGHRFTLKTKAGRKLVDLGLGAEHEHRLKPGQEVTVEGEEKPGEIKARKLRQGGADWEPAKAKGAPKPAHGAADERKGRPDDEPAVSDEHVTKALDDAGYTDHGERVRKPRHVEVAATKEGKRYKVHVHWGGVKKADPAD